MGQYLRMEQDEKLEALTANSGGNDSDDEDFFEYDSDYKNVGRMSVSHRYSAMGDHSGGSRKESTFHLEVDCFHFVLMVCGMVGSVAFVCSRWIQIRLSDSANNVDHWIAVSGISLYVGGLFLMSLMDLVFKRLFDSHRRRLYGYHLLNAVYYAFVVGHYAWQNTSWWLVALASLSAIISMFVVVLHAVSSWRTKFGKDLERMIVPGW